MREVVRERLASGQTPDEVLAYFVEKYGTWILLAPPRRGFTLLVWAAPLAALLVGLGVVALSIRRWSGARGRSRPAEPAPPIDAATRARIRREAG